MSRCCWRPTGGGCPNGSGIWTWGRYTPEELTGLLAHLAGLLERSTPVRAGELVSRFDWARVRSADVIVDDTILRG